MFSGLFAFKKLLCESRIFPSKCISLSVKFHTIFPRPLFFEENETFEERKILPLA